MFLFISLCGRVCVIITVSEVIIHEEDEGWPTITLKWRCHLSVCGCLTSSRSDMRRPARSSSLKIPHFVAGNPNTPERAVGWIADPLHPAIYHPPRDSSCGKAFELLSLASTTTTTLLPEFHSLLFLFYVIIPPCSTTSAEPFNLNSPIGGFYLLSYYNDFY